LFIYLVEDDIINPKSKARVGIKLKYGKRIIENHPYSGYIFVAVLLVVSFCIMQNEINVRFIKELTAMSVTVVSILAAILITALTLMMATNAMFSIAVKRKARLATLVL
jgi:hypothetical protein